MEIINKYFDAISESQKSQFSQLIDLYRDWNNKINVISRKDIDNLYTHHILHSLSIAKFVKFKDGATVLDLGTGGGFPGIPLAIFFPQTQFVMVDGTGKKIMVVNQVSNALGLKNVDARHIRAEELKKEKFDYIMARAVTKIDKLVLWSRPLIKHKQQHSIPNGLITLKGGDIKGEIKLLGKSAYTEFYPLDKFFEEAYFIDKYLVYVQI